jgi:hypothetical protein
MRILRIVPLATTPSIVFLLTALAVTPASAHVVLDAANFTTHLCTANCADQNAGAVGTGSFPDVPNGSATTGSSEAGFQGNYGRDPSVFAFAHAVGAGNDVRANILVQYFFEVFGPNGIENVPVTAQAVISVGGSAIGGGFWSSTAVLSLGSRSIGENASSTMGPPSTLDLDKTFSLSTDTVYSISLFADAHAQSFFLGDAANDVFASIDPTLSVPDGYSIAFSEGIGSAVPEPSTWAMMIIGFLGLGWLAYGKRLAATVRFA